MPLRRPSRTFRSFEIYLVTAAIYFLICFPLTQSSPRAEARLQHPWVVWYSGQRPEGWWELQAQPDRGVPGARRGTSVQANVAGCFRYSSSVAWIRARVRSRLARPMP